MTQRSGPIKSPDVPKRGAFANSIYDYSFALELLLQARADDFTLLTLQEREALFLLENATYDDYLFRLIASAEQAQIFRLRGQSLT